MVIICHGFIGNRIGVNRLFFKAAKKLSAAGYGVLRFDYQGCGESTGDYGDNTMPAFVQQTIRMIDYVVGLDFVDPNQIILIGHSLGGATASLTAAFDKRVKKLILWAAVGYPFEDITRIVGTEVYQNICKYGTTDYLGFELKDTFFRGLRMLYPFEHCQQYEHDVLILHGKQDEDIPMEYAYKYEQLYRKRAIHGLSGIGSADVRRYIIERGDRTFSNSRSSEELYAQTLYWLQQTTSPNEQIYIMQTV